VSTCALCGRDLDDHDRHVRFRLPGPVLHSPKQDRTPGSWLSGADATASVLMQIPGIGAFVRALLPVHLSGGYRVTYGVWVGIHPDDLQRSAAAWWAPEYAQLRLAGHLANQIPPWGLLASRVELGVVNPKHTPYCVASSDSHLSAILNDEWDHELVLSALP
jgi:hypothetical protein